MRLDFILLGFLVLSACKEEKKSINPLIGDWSLIVDSTREEDLYRYPRQGKGKLYSFLNDSMVDTKTFYHKSWDKSNECEQSKIFDSKTQYKFSGDTLLILNLAKENWDSIGRVRISKDTLKVFRENSVFLYRKELYPQKSKESFDQIILSSSMCFGTCPAIDVSIDLDGQVYFNGDSYVENLGLHKSHISKDLFNEISEAFEKANLFNLEESYHADWTDDFTVSMTFIKGGKIVKSITDYGEISPPEFVFAYQKIKFLLQSMELNDVDSELLYDSIGYYKPLFYEDTMQQLRMSDSESFFLSSLLNKAEVTNRKFDENYTLAFYRSTFLKLCDKNYSQFDKNEKIVKITTDGRFYKFYFKDEEPITLDIKRNFISESKVFLEVEDK